MFRSSDKRIEQLTRRDADRLRVYILEEHIDYFSDNHPFTFVEYRCTAAEARDRLELKGFTLEIARARFYAGLGLNIQLLESLIRADRVYEKLATARKDELRILRSLTIEVWLEAIVRIREEQLTKDTLEEMDSRNEDLSLVRYMLNSPNNLYGFPSPGYDIPKYDYLLFLRLVVESSSPDDELSYDLSPLVSGGYIKAEDDVVSLAESDTDTTAVFSQSVIVLTEGTTDRNFLERSLNLLYPHLAGYFHFFEFDLNHENRVSGGVGPLTNLVRAFAGASVKHRILALFDNDTAAKEALRNIDSSILPENIIFRFYPELEFAKEYPTVGPTGTTHMNVNGLAGSIEMYLGLDILQDDDGHLLPVKWTGYSKSVDAYQGELMDKRRVQERFREKLNICERFPDRLNCYDWNGIKAILQEMRTAFNSLDSDLILSSYQMLDIDS